MSLNLAMSLSLGFFDMGWARETLQAADMFGVFTMSRALLFRGHISKSDNAHLIYFWRYCLCPLKQKPASFLTLAC